MSFPLTGDYAAINRAQYPFGSAPVTLFDGTVISDPAGTQAERADCVPYQCGADPANMAARQWCSWYG
jgi:hypothetical protein